MALAVHNRCGATPGAQASAVKNESDLRLAAIRRAAAVMHASSRDASIADSPGQFRPAAVRRTDQLMEHTAITADRERLSHGLAVPAPELDHVLS
jgi:hypothetical protein